MSKNHSVYYEKCPRCFNTIPHNQYHKSVNSSNRPEIKDYIAERLCVKSMEGDKKGEITIIDIWDVETETSVKFNLTDFMSQKLTWEVLKTQN